MIYLIFCKHCRYAIATKSLTEGKIFLSAHYHKSHNKILDPSDYGYFQYKNIKSTNLIIPIRQKKNSILNDDLALKIINDTIRYQQKQLREIYGKSFLPENIKIHNLL